METVASWSLGEILETTGIAETGVSGSRHKTGIHVGLGAECENLPCGWRLRTQDVLDCLILLEG
jgi:hypothetical protein